MLPVYLKYPNNLYNRQKRLTEKDNLKRIVALKSEYYNLSIHILERNAYISQFSIFCLHRKLYPRVKHEKMAAVRNRCVITGRKHGINPRFKLSGLFLKLNPGQTYLLTRYNK